MAAVRGADGARPRCAVLVPAHDESHGIAATLASIRPQLVHGDRMLVVADNCTDATAAIARASGAEVVERTDASRRGKGHAMAAGVRALAGDPPDVVVFVDADCDLAPGSLDRLVRHVAATRQPAQAGYRMEVPAQAVHGVRLLQFAWILRNHTRAHGLHRLVGGCQLQGSGMAIPWQALQHVRLDTDDLTEDLRLGLELALAGWTPEPCPGAVVVSRFPATARGRSSQRRRWEQGHLATLVRRVPVLLVRGLLRADVKLVGMGLDLMVPPLALLAAVLVAHGLLGAFLVADGGSGLALAVAIVALSLLATAVALAWLRDARGMVPAATFLLVPAHVLRRVPSHVELLFLRAGWNRAERPGS